MLLNIAAIKVKNLIDPFVCFFRVGVGGGGVEGGKQGLAYLEYFASCGGCLKLSLVMRKPAFCICENKDADQLRGNREADQRLCFRYTDSTIPLLPKS